jgi:hypothetical protein
MPAARLSACSGSAWLRPDGDDPIPTRRAPPPNAEVVGSVPIDTTLYEPRRSSAVREPSLSLELPKVGRVFLSPLFWRLRLLTGGSKSGEEGMGKQRESDVTVPTVPAPYLVVREAHFSLCLLEADLHSPAAAGYLRQSTERRTLGTEDCIRGEFFGLFDGAPYQ